MPSDKDIEGYARECARLAQLTTDPQIRERLFQMAREWMAVAMQEENAPEPNSALALT
jgi:hypothetical protein